MIFQWMNLAVIEGNCTGAPTYRAGDSDRKQSFAGFRVAMNPRVRNGDKWDDGAPVFIGVKAFGHLADRVNEKVRKGTRLCIQGSISEDKWEKDGVKYASIVIVADKIVTHEKGERAAPPEQRPSDGETEAAFGEFEVELEPAAS
jgi:single-strand DNA-binding protein